ncbi:MAG: hypothetical protein H6702_25770 [Myxococcales bacterium]|nr:hypothetical protein [Myxococcales bacterium]
MEFIDRLLQADPLVIYGVGGLILVIAWVAWKRLSADLPRAPRPPKRPRGPGYAQAEQAWMALGAELGVDVKPAGPKVEQGGERPAQVGGWRAAGEVSDRAVRVWSTWGLYARFSPMAQREVQDLERSGGVHVACAGPTGRVPTPEGWAVKLLCKDGWLRWEDDREPGDEPHPVWGTSVTQVPLSPKQVAAFVRALVQAAAEHEG